MNKETFENSKQGLPQLGKKELNDLASAYFGGKSKQEATLEQIDQTNPVTRGSTALVYKEETLEEPAEWLNKKFNGKGVEVKIIDWGNNKIYNYPPKKLLEEYSKWQQERMYSEERVEKQKLEFAIEQLNKLEFDPKENILDFVLHIKNKIKELEKKLKQL